MEALHAPCLPEKSQNVGIPSYRCLQRPLKTRSALQAAERPAETKQAVFFVFLNKYSNYITYIYFECNLKWLAKQSECYRGDSDFKTGHIDQVLKRVTLFSPSPPSCFCQSPKMCPDLVLALPGPTRAHRRGRGRSQSPAPAAASSSSLFSSVRNASFPSNCENAADLVRRRATDGGDRLAAFT